MPDFAARLPEPIRKFTQSIEDADHLSFLQGGGHGGHNGLRDLIQHCGREFMRLRLGVGHPGHKDQVTSYVLMKASSDVDAAINRNIDDAVEVMPLLIDEGLNAAMKKLHTQD